MYNHLQQLFHLNYLLPICILSNHHRISQIHQQRYFYNHQILFLSKTKDSNCLHLDKKEFAQNNYYFLTHRKNQKYPSRVQFMSHLNEKQEFLFQRMLPLVKSD